MSSVCLTTAAQGLQLDIVRRLRRTLVYLGQATVLFMLLLADDAVNAETLVVQRDDDVLLCRRRGRWGPTFSVDDLPCSSERPALNFERRFLYSAFGMFQQQIQEVRQSPEPNVTSSSWSCIGNTSHKRLFGHRYFRTHFWIFRPVFKWDHLSYPSSAIPWSVCLEITSAMV